MKFGKAVWSYPSIDYRGGMETVGGMCERLSNGGFNLIIPVVKDEATLFAYQTKSGTVHPILKDWDALKVLVKEAHNRGLKVHPWFCVFRETANSVLLKQKPHAAAIDREGKPVELWACPTRDEVQDYEFSLYEEVMDGYEVDGMHLDYIRHNGENMCFCGQCKEKFADLNPDVYADPAKIDTRAQAWSRWLDFRANTITRFVARVSKAVKERKLEVSAAVFADYPDSFIRVGQDWVEWAEKGYVDFLFPMNYTNSVRLAARRARNHVAQVRGACPIWEGLAPWLPLTTQQLVDEAKAVLAEGVQGIVLFCYHTLKDADIQALKQLDE